VADLDVMPEFRLRGRAGAADLRRLHFTAEKDTDFEETLLGANEEITDIASEHDALVRGVDALLAELDGGFAEALPGVAEVVGEMGRERGFGRGPAVVSLAFFDDLLAVVTDVAGHTSD